MKDSLREYAIHYYNAWAWAERLNQGDGENIDCLGSDEIIPGRSVQSNEGGEIDGLVGKGISLPPRPLQHGIEYAMNILADQFGAPVMPAGVERTYEMEESSPAS